MTIPLFVLSVGAIFSGWLGYELFGQDMARFWGDSILILPEHAMENAHHVPKWVKLLPIVLAASGVFRGAVLRGLDGHSGQGCPRAQSGSRLLQQMVLRRAVRHHLRRPAVRIGAFLWQRGDRDTIDGFGPDGLSGLVVRVSAAASRLRSASSSTMPSPADGVVVLVTWYYLRFGGM